MKKFLSLLISLCIFLACIPITAAAKSSTMNIYGLYLTAEGDATLIESDGKWLLIDTGFETSSKELLKNSYLFPFFDLKIPYYYTTLCLFCL